jgi:GMP reductase
MRAKFPDILLMVGNAVTAELTEDLILSGADIVKCGIGGGSACITRRITGVGRPQLSTIFECADTAHGVGGMICSDGGIVYAGDVVKAFGAGADLVMMGGFFAGCDQATGDLIEKRILTNELDKDGKQIVKTEKYKIFYGMSSEFAQKTHYDGMPDYRASEGRFTAVPSRGSIEKLIQEILGGLRSCMTYIGARRLKDISKCTTFYRVNMQLNTVFGD